MLKKLIKLADFLDSIGSRKEADTVDSMIEKVALIIGDPEPSRFYSDEPEGKEFPGGQRFPQELGPEWDEPMGKEPTEHLESEELPEDEPTQKILPRHQTLEKNVIRYAFFDGEEMEQGSDEATKLYSELGTDPVYRAMANLFYKAMEGEFDRDRDIAGVLHLARKMKYDLESFKGAMVKAAKYLGMVMDLKNIYSRHQEKIQELLSRFSADNLLKIMRWTPGQSEELGIPGVLDESEILQAQKELEDLRGYFMETGARAESFEAPNLTYEDFERRRLDDLDWIAGDLYQDFQTMDLPS